MSRLALSVLLLATASPLAAQTAAEPSKQDVGGDDYHRDDHEQAIIITGTSLSGSRLLAGTSAISGTELAQDARGQIGDTLTALPGVSATSFAPGASRPVLRGFQGERVRVLTDGIGSIDASNTSADHGVAIDPLTTERIEVLHGPAVLLYGSQAIGGAVNALDKRIPRRLPDEPVHFDLLGGYGTAADDRSIGGSVDAPIGGGFVVHVDANHRKTDDMRTGGFILSPELRAEQLEIAAEEEEEGHLEEAEEARKLASQRGRIPNSATKLTTAGAGISYIGDRGHLGFSFGYYDSDYGVPTPPGLGHHHEEEGEGEGEEEAEHEHGEEAVTIGLRQYRGDLRGEWETDGGFFERIRVRAGAASYRHTEFEGDEVGTIFKTKGMEGRIELVQRERGGWRGVSGLQHAVRDFEAIGAEAFVPPNETYQTGLFTLQQFRWDKFGMELGARYERTKVSADDLGVERRFGALSGALGLFYEPSSQLKFGVNLSRAERAPSAEELFSDGPHIATSAYELGNPLLAKEKNWGAEAYVRATGDGYSLSATAYGNWFDNFIYAQDIGEEEDELPVFQYLQRDARYLGFELEGSATLARFGGTKIVADVVADYVHASLGDGGGPVPRIPPLRLLGGIEAQSDHFDARLETEWTARQGRTAAFETETDGFTLVNASLAWRPWGRARNIALLASANNIFDVEARRHASFTKDFVPLAGRDFRIGARLSF